MLFRRRWVQEMLNDLSGHMTGEQQRQLCRRLNSPKEEALHAQWEASVAWAASRVAEIEYEPNTGGPKKADLIIRRKILVPIEVMAEITSVSSKGFDDLNPIDRFYDQLFAELRDLWFIGGYQMSIGTYHTGEGRRMKFLAAVPHPKDYERFFGDDFQSFARKVRRREVCSYQVDEPRIQVSLSYNPTLHNGISGGWSGSEAITSLTKNPLYSALKEKKQQLKGTGFQGLKGIVVCDSGTAAFRRGRDSTGSSPSINIDTIINKFLRDSEGVDFVVALTHYSWHNKSVHSLVDRPGSFPLGPDVMLYVQSTIDKERYSALRKLFMDIGGIIPKPLADARSVLRWQQRLKGKSGYCLSGGSTDKSSTGKTGTVTRIPARLLIDFMLGEVTYEQFTHEAEFALSLVRNAKRLGETMRKSQVIKRDDDDDWFEIEFEGPDPAEGPLRSVVSSQ